MEADPSEEIVEIIVGVLTMKANTPTEVETTTDGITATFMVIAEEGIQMVADFGIFEEAIMEDIKIMVDIKMGFKIIQEGPYTKRVMMIMMITHQTMYHLDKIIVVVAVDVPRSVGDDLPT